MHKGPTEGVLLRIFIGESDHLGGKPLYEALVLQAREQGLAGATVLRGPMGFGHASRLHTAKILRLSDDLPIVVEIVDSEEKVKVFLDSIEAQIPSGLVTVEKVRILRYGRAAENRAGDPGT
jgi:PII-like signaling protein